MVSEEAIRKLCTRFSIFPPFIDTLYTFGQRSISSSNTTGTYHGIVTEDAGYFGKFQTDAVEPE